MNALNSRDRLTVRLSGERGSVMWMSETSFDQVITEHLTLSERNKRLERTMPLDRYREQREEESAREGIASPRDDLPSWWETKDGECPPPPLDWADDG
jgi:hypothetical protein